MLKPMTTPIRSPASGPSIRELERIPPGFAFYLNKGLTALLIRLTTS